MSDIIPQLGVTLEQLGNRLRQQPGSSVACLLPLLFNFNGKPLEITKDYFFHEPVFKLNGRPQKTLLKASRQVGKSLGAAADSILLTALVPNFKYMIAFPLQSQANLFSSDYVQKLIDNSPFFKHLSNDAGGKSAVFQKDIGDNGTMYFRYIGNGADRARGSASSAMAADELQDHDPDNVEVIIANMMASEFSITKDGIHVIQDTSYGSKYDPTNTIFAIEDESLEKIVNFFNRFNIGVNLKLEDFNFLRNI